MDYINLNEKIPCKGEYDIIVCGAGVAGIAAAVTASRAGKKVLIFEKTAMLGGLATTGLVNYFVPMCNGRGVQIIKGMADELFRLSTKHSWDTIPSDWKNGEPGKDSGTQQRMVTRYSPSIFALELTKLVVNSGVDLLFDCVFSSPVMDGNICKGVILESKSGREFYGCKVVIDATGDCDVAYRAGIPTVQGGNYHTYYAHGTTIEAMKNAIDDKNLAKASTSIHGGVANLYGGGHPEGMPLYTGTSVENVSEYFIKNQLELLEKMTKFDRNDKTLVMLPGMAQFRTTRHIDGAYTLREEDKYRHFDDSISAICDFDRKDFLYEVSYGCLIHKSYGNLLAVGRCASATGYGWDILRVIPPAIVTGQAAGQAASDALDDSKAVTDICISKLQKELEAQNVIIHFDDSLVPADREKVETGGNEGHI